MGIFGKKVAGDISIFSKKWQETIKQIIPTEANIIFCLQGGLGVGSEALIVLPSEVYIVKKPFVGYETSSFFYKDITNIETEKGLQLSSIKFFTKMDTYKKSKFLGNLFSVPGFMANNCFTFENEYLQIFSPYTDEIRTLVRESKNHSEGNNQKSRDEETSQGNIADQLEKLSSLRQTGALSEEEYLQAKKKILEA